MQENTKGKRIGHYQILRSLGKGATAEVFLATDVLSDVLYALKIGNNKELMETEAGILQKINSEFFPQYQEYLQGQDALVMEYIPGKSLQEILEGGRQFQTEEIMYLMQRILKGLSYLHQHKHRMVYRDLKPANIMIEESGRVRLLDVGGVFLTGQAQNKTVHAGTYGYAAPEQFWPGMEPTPACDIYAVGKLMLYLFTGRDPAHPPYHTEEMQRKDKRIPEPFKDVIDRCLAMNPQARYEEAGELLKALCRAYELSQKKQRLFLFRKKECIYEKCIWKSEYRQSMTGI